MVALNWQDLRPLDGSQNAAFEELCCQLAEYEIEDKAEFIRKATPDAGVECFVILANGDEICWQAKFFDSFGDSQWQQLDDSVSTALQKHPRLIEYVICVPIDRPDARIEGRRSLLDRWNERVEKWTEWASDSGMQVRFRYWGSYEIIERLSREEHRGRLLFWFGRESFSQQWFSDRLHEAISIAGPRYTPEVDVELPIAQIFDGLGRTPAFEKRVMLCLREMKRTLSRIYSRPNDARLIDSISHLNQVVDGLLDIIRSVKWSSADPIPWNSLEESFKQIMGFTQGCFRTLQELKDEPSPSIENQSDQFISAGVDSRQSQLRDTENSVRRFEAEVYEFERFFADIEAQLASKPCLLLTGAAGMGKTHLLCDVAKHRVDAGMPTILLMGQHFTREEPWSQILRQSHLPFQTTADDFLGALEAAAQVRGVKALLLVDALNEGDGRMMWPNYLAGILETVSRYRWVAIAFSVRSTYETLVIPEGIEDRFVRIQHNGFAEHEYDAMKTFFGYYRIERPSTPLLIPEFKTPLFLKMLCSGLRASGLSRIPTGLHGITETFQLFVNAIEKKLSGPEYLDYYQKQCPVWRSISNIASEMASRQQDWLPLDEALAITDGILPRQGYEKSLYHHLVSEGILIENVRWMKKYGSQEVARFGYEKFSDHLIVQHLIENHLNTTIPEESFESGQPLASIIENPERNAGLIEALSVQLPEQVGRELPDIVPMLAESHTVCLGFIESLIWRKTDAFTDSTKSYLNHFADFSDYMFEKLLDALLTVTTIPDHPYNADFLHARLMQDDMAERDAWWSIFLHQQYGTHSAVDRLIDWAWSSEEKSHISDEAIRLCGIALTWFLTTSNRFLRDRATKALVSLYAGRLHILGQVTEQFKDVNDLYVMERLLAVIYGSVLRTGDDNQNNHEIARLAQTVYDWVFRDGAPAAHLLLRDYARGIVEFAIHRGLKIDVDLDRIKPPYSSEWIDFVPSEDEFEAYGAWEEGMPDEEWARVAIHHSLNSKGFGDFGHYIVERYTSNWLALRLEEPRWLSPEEKLDLFEESLSATQRELWEEYQTIRKDRFRQIWKFVENRLDEGLQISFRLVEEDSDKVSQIEVDETAESDEAERMEKQLRGHLSEEQLQKYEEEIHPILVSSHRFVDRPQFDQSIAERWIAFRVFDLGWTVERFGRFDRSLDYRQDSRSAHKAERIGKKYQWIALFEFLARLADNFQYRDSLSSHSLNDQYVGPWQIGARDIDPSSIIPITRQGDGWASHPHSWWAPATYNSWEQADDDVDWIRNDRDMPNVEDLFEVTNPLDGSRWLVIDSHYRWEQPIPLDEDPDVVTTRNIWYQLTGYIIHRSDADELLRWSSQQNFMGLWMPETRELYEIFLGEYFWSSIHSFFDDPYQQTTGWQSHEESHRIPKPIMPFTDGYGHENQGYDCSVDESIFIKLPHRQFVAENGLWWNGVEGSFFDQDHNLIAFDPSVTSPGPRALLLKRDSLLDFLSRLDLTILWTVTGERQLIGGVFRHDEWKGVMDFSGGYVLQDDGSILGQINSVFRSRDE